MASPLVVWSDKTTRLVKMPDDTFVIEQIAKDKDALGNEHWVQVQFNQDLFVTICRAIFG